MKRLKELRKEQGWSQQLLAEQLNVAQNTISQWERGEREPDFDTLARIAELFEVSTDYLLELTDDPTDWDNYDEYIPAHFNGDAKKYHAFLKARDEDRMRAMAADSLITQMDDLTFALAGEVKDLTDEQKRSIIAFAQLLKQQQKKQD